ncbi:ABC transporter substrate-binding protein [Sphingosinithalassobacter sp. LHW66-3]|uniref:ABC transporter substrate-binding protein n=1 Tax=Sphingosinithalassobacter sp. LHW66-3 TaxID=3424718 RepID=UPI003D6A4D66
MAATACYAFPSFASVGRRGDPATGLLLPLTGERARLGNSMRQAALLAESGEFLKIHDTGDTAAGAAAAATAALREGAALLLGPLLAEQVPAVGSTAAGRVPVIAFSNDAVLRQPSTYIFGITAGQVTSAILRYARSRGVRSVAVIDDRSPWSAAAALAAGRMEAELGLRVRILEVVPGQPLPDPGEAPDAVLLPGSGEAVLAAARTLKDSGIQLLGTLQALDHRPAALDVLDGAWLASPSPDEFGRFAAEFEARNGGGAGAITALAYDAASIAKTLREAEKLGTQGLLESPGFRCVTGPVRFRTDGSVARDFAILVASPSGYQAVAVSSGS